MDKNTMSENRSLLDAAIAAAGALGVTLRAEPAKADMAVERVQGKTQMRIDTQADAQVSVTRGKQTWTYVVEVKRGLQPATLGVVLHRWASRSPGQRAMLVTDYVTPALADQLKAQGVQFLDTAGNAYIEQGPLLVWVKGQKRPEQMKKASAAAASGRAFQPTGLQVVFTLLCNPGSVNLPYRELARMAGVAHGTVGWVMPDLQKDGYVKDLDGRRGTRRLFQQAQLAAYWAGDYARTLRPRTLLGRYYVETLDDWTAWPLVAHGALWGGEPAGALLTDHLRPGELTIYADKVPAQLAARLKWMKTPEPGRTAVVEVRKRFWDFSSDSAHPETVPPLLVYADLLAMNDARCLETAKMIYDNDILRLLGQA